MNKNVLFFSKKKQNIFLESCQTRLSFAGQSSYSPVSLVYICKRWMP